MGTPGSENLLASIADVSLLVYDVTNKRWCRVPGSSPNDSLGSKGSSNVYIFKEPSQPRTIRIVVRKLGAKIEILLDCYMNDSMQCKHTAGTFFEWRDVKNGHVYGLNFSTEHDADHFVKTMQNFTASKSLTDSSQYFNKSQGSANKTPKSSYTTSSSSSSSSSESANLLKPKSSLSLPRDVSYDANSLGKYTADKYNRPLPPLPQNFSDTYHIYNEPTAYSVSQSFKTQQDEHSYAQGLGRLQQKTAGKPTSGSQYHEKFLQLSIPPPPSFNKGNSPSTPCAYGPSSLESMSPISSRTKSIYPPSSNANKIGSPTPSQKYAKPAPSVPHFTPVASPLTSNTVPSSPNVSGGAPPPPPPPPPPPSTAASTPAFSATASKTGMKTHRSQSVGLLDSLSMVQLRRLDSASGNCDSNVSSGSSSNTNGVIDMISEMAEALKKRKQMSDDNESGSDKEKTSLLPNKFPANKSPTTLSGSDSSKYFKKQPSFPASSSSSSLADKVKKHQSATPTTPRIGSALTTLYEGGREGGGGGGDLENLVQTIETLKCEVAAFKIEMINQFSKLKEDIISAVKQELNRR